MARRDELRDLSYIMIHSQIRQEIGALEYEPQGSKILLLKMEALEHETSPPLAAEWQSKCTGIGGPSELPHSTLNVTS